MRHTRTLYWLNWLCSCRIAFHTPLIRYSERLHQVALASILRRAHQTIDELYSDNARCLHSSWSEGFQTFLEFINNLSRGRAGEECGVELLPWGGWTGYKCGIELLHWNGERVTNVESNYSIGGGNGGRMWSRITPLDVRDVHLL